MSSTVTGRGTLLWEKYMNMVDVILLLPYDKTRIFFSISEELI
jgi:hypothetical protein